MVSNIKFFFLVVSISSFHGTVLADNLWCTGGGANFCTDERVVEMLINPKNIVEDFDKVRLRKKILNNEANYIENNSGDLNKELNSYGIAESKTINLWNDTVGKQFSSSSKRKDLVNKLVKDLIIFPPDFYEQGKESEDEKWFSNFLKELNENYDFHFENLDNKIVKKKIFTLVIASAIGNHIFVDVEFDRETFISIWNQLQKLFNIIKEKDICKNCDSSNAVAPGVERGLDKALYDVNVKLQEYFIANFPDKFLESLNTDYEEILTNEINKNIDFYEKDIKEYKDIFESYMESIAYFNKKNPAFSNNDFQTWRDGVILGFHANIRRDVRLFESGMKTPKVDRVQGNLFLHKSYYDDLKSKGLLKYLMMHEAVHVEENSLKKFDNSYQSLQRVIPDFFKLIQILDFDTDIENITNEIKLVQGELESQYKYFSQINFKNEAMIDIKVIDQLVGSEKDKYLEMLKLTLPMSQKYRIRILEKYIDTVKKVNEAEFSNEDLVSAFIIRFLVHEVQGKKFLDDIPYIYTEDSKKTNRQHKEFYNDLYESWFKVDENYIPGSEYIIENEVDYYSLYTIKKIINGFPDFLEKNKTVELSILLSVFNDLFDISGLSLMVNGLVDNQIKLSKILK